jgi:hypothetical protein
MSNSRHTERGLCGKCAFWSKYFVAPISASNYKHFLAHTLLSPHLSLSQPSSSMERPTFNYSHPPHLRMFLTIGYPFTTESERFIKAINGAAASGSPSRISSRNHSSPRATFECIEIVDRCGVPTQSRKTVKLQGDPTTLLHRTSTLYQANGVRRMQPTGLICAWNSSWHLGQLAS